MEKLRYMQDDQERLARDNRRKFLEYFEPRMRGIVANCFLGVPRLEKISDPGQILDRVVRNCQDFAKKNPNPEQKGVIARAKVIEMISKDRDGALRYAEWAAEYENMPFDKRPKRKGNLSKSIRKTPDVDSPE